MVFNLYESLQLISCDCYLKILFRSQIAVIKSAVLRAEKNK